MNGHESTDWTCFVSKDLNVLKHIKQLPWVLECRPGDPFLSRSESLAFK